MPILSRLPTMLGAVLLGLALSLVLPLPSHATLPETFGGPGGAHFATNCPSDRVLVGLRGCESRP